jgi:RND superfamily putative drug exporter
VLLALATATFVVLAVVLRSIVLALKAVLMNALTLCAAFGALVVVFQDGRLEGVLDYESPGTLELSLPLLLVAVGFALTTDYGLFVLVRIKEAHDSGMPDAEAVPIGLERAGRIITACAAVIGVALLAFTTSRIVFIKELGVGLALAVLLDATLVRAVLVPSLMGLLGRWNWWLPAPLRRLERRAAVVR